MTQSSSSCTVSSLAQRLKRQSLQDGREERRGEETILFGLPRPTPSGRRASFEHGIKAKPFRCKANRTNNNKEPAEPINLVRKVTDENVGPELPKSFSRGIKREEISPPKQLSHLVPRPMQSAGLPSMSVRALPTGRTSPLSLSDREPVLRQHRSPPLAPPLKRFCRSLTEDLPRPKPLRPVLAAPGHGNTDYLRGLIARRLRTRSSTSSSFSSSRSSFRRWSAVASSGYSSCLSLPEADGEPNSSSVDQKYEGEDRLNHSQDELVSNPSMTRSRDCFHGGRSFLCGLPELQQRDSSPSCPSWLCTRPEPFLQDEEHLEEDEDEEEDRTLCEDTRWSSPYGLEGLDLDSMEKDDSWKL